MEIRKLCNRCLFLAILLCMPFLALAVCAQSFTRHLQEPVQGQGKVVINHDARLDSIVNGLIYVPSKSEIKTKVESKQSIQESMHKSTQSKVSEALPIGQVISGASVRERVKGYRIQVFFGGNQRKDQTKAQQLGAKVQSRYPELRAYTSFESPHWRCRVGDFKTQEEAAPYVRKLRSSGYCPDATVVRSEIFVYE